VKTIELRICKSSNGKAPFADWFHKLDRKTRFKISAALFQMEEGNFGDSKFVGKGVWERRVHSGPGYRVYFAKERNYLVILLGGGSKSRQALDIQRAQLLCTAYRTTNSRE
jgi:putative addiction module killer protein